MRQPLDTEELSFSLAKSYRLTLERKSATLLPAGVTSHVKFAHLLRTNFLIGKSRLLPHHRRYNTAPSGHCRERDSSLLCDDSSLSDLGCSSVVTSCDVAFAQRPSPTFVGSWMVSNSEVILGFNSTGGGTCGQIPDSHSDS